MELIGSMRRCKEYFGGVTEAIVSDGIKSAVSKACKYEPVINKHSRILRFTMVVWLAPARPYSPQDKALVEGAIKQVYQRIFYPLSKMTFFSMPELNAAIRELLVKYNNYVFQLTNYSRRELFLSFCPQRKSISSLFRQPRMNCANTAGLRFRRWDSPSVREQALLQCSVSLYWKAGGTLLHLECRGDLLQS